VKKLKKHFDENALSSIKEIETRAFLNKPSGGKKRMPKIINEYDTPGGNSDDEEEEYKEEIDTRDFISEFRLKPTYFFDGSNQSLEQWIEQEIPGVKVTIETVPSQQTNDLCTARVRITSNYSTKNNSEIFETFETKV
jgi:hypothetical protein